MSKQTEFRPPSSENGPTIVVLAHPFQFKGETQDRVTIPHLTGKHLMRLNIRDGNSATIGDQIAWASWVVLPLGAVEDMHPADALAVGGKLFELLGKSLATGETPSE
jgi:hypothetical protein